MSTIRHLSSRQKLWLNNGHLMRTRMDLKIDEPNMSIYRDNSAVDMEKETSLQMSIVSIAQLR